MAWPYGRRWAQLVKRLPPGTQCAIGLPACLDEATTFDHYPVPVAEIRARRPYLDPLAYDPANLRPACQACNARTGQALGVQSRRRNGRRTPARARRPTFTDLPTRAPARKCPFHTDCGSVHSAEW